MADFKAAYINELVKMRHKSKIVTGAVLSLVAAVIYQIALSVISSGIGIQIGDGASFALSILGFYSVTLLPLFAVFVVIDSFNGEMAANTMKQTLARPLNRFGVFCSKVAAVATFLALSLLFMMVTTSIIGFIMRFNAGFSLVSLGRVVIAYLVTWLPLMVFLTVVIFMAQFSKNGILTFFLSVFVFLALQALRFFNPQLSNLLIVPLFDWYIGWIADAANFGTLFRQFSLLAGSGLAFFGLGCYLFEKRNY